MNAEPHPEQTKEDVLEELFVDRSTILDQNVLKELLINYIQLTKEGGIVLTTNFQKLNRHQKVLIILLARKVLKLKMGLEEKVTPKDIIDITGLPRGTVAPSVRDLESEGYIRSEQGAYWIPDSLVLKAKQKFLQK